MILAFMLIPSIHGRDMRKDIPFVDRQQTFTLNVSRLIQFIFATGHKCTFGETYRTPLQAALYHKQGIGSLDSNHCHRLAIDLNIFDEKNVYLHDAKDYKEFAEFWIKLNPFNEAGYYWKMKDANHFEMD